MVDRLLTDAQSIPFKRSISRLSRPLLGSAIGDSITAQSVSNTSTQTRSFNNNGYVTWMRAYAKQRIQMPIEYVQGVGGQTANQILARIPDILALSPRPDFCVVYLGTNPGSGDVRALVSAALKQLLAAGILPVLVCIQPGTVATTSPDVRKFQIDYSNWIIQLSQGSPTFRASAGLDPWDSFLVVNPTRYMLDNTVSTGAPIAGMLSDGLHPGAAGAEIIGREIAFALVAHFDLHGPAPMADALDTFVAGTAGVSPAATIGNILPATLGIMQGIGGTVSADTATGATRTNNGLATGLNYRRWAGNSTCNVTLSKIPKADPLVNGDRQCIEVTGIVPAATSPQVYDDHRFAMTILAANLTVGDYIYIEGEVEVIGTPVGLRSLQLGVNNVARDGKDSGSNVWQQGKIITLRSPPFLVSAAADLACYFNVWMDTNVSGGTAKVAFDRLVARKCGALG